MALYHSMQELIGNTPTVELSNINKGLGSKLFAKLELYNPAGSVKDRVGRYMVADAERKGLLKPGYTIVEATAGNTGLGIAFAAMNKGYHVIFVVPEKFSQEKQQLMMALGAEIINTPRKDGMLGAAAKAEELLQTIPNAIALRQFKNQSNPKAHYETTGPEIYEDMRGRIDYIVLGAGSGGTFTGVVRYLKEQKPEITAVLADPVGSAIGGGEHGDYNIEGIGNDFIANLVKETGESVNILSANTRSVGGIGYGQMIVEFPKDPKASKAVQEYFKKIGMKQMEIDREVIG